MCQAMTAGYGNGTVVSRETAYDASAKSLRSAFAKLGNLDVWYNVDVMYLLTFETVLQQFSKRFGIF